MADFLTTFIETGDGGDFRKMDDLKLNVIYKIHEFRMKKTDFGPSLEAEVEDPDTAKNFYCFFPERFAKQVKTEEQLKELNDHQMSFIYKGRVKKVAIIEFLKQ